MNKIAIIHYLPLEYYPPVTNFVNYLSCVENKKFKSVRVFTTHNVKGRKEYRILRDECEKKIRIKRSSFPKAEDNNIVRLFKYLHFNLLTLVYILFYKPDKILYYESYSVWPVFIYSRFFNQHCSIFIHNHEYSSRGWYSKTRKHIQYFHCLEKKWLYPKAKWISQTNKNRLNLFYNDHPKLKLDQLKIMPNYPPKKWLKGEDVNSNQGEVFCNNLLTLKNEKSGKKYNPIKIVYVGSLSLNNTYLDNFCKWIKRQNGALQFDIYSYNIHSDTVHYLNNLENPYVNFYNKGIEYIELPFLLSNYDVGVIFYKAYSENVINCVSNKFYEYLALNLDIWFSEVMISTHKHITTETYPKVIPVNFEQLDTFDWERAICKVDCKYKPSKYYCENVYGVLLDEVCKSID